MTRSKAARKRHWLRWARYMEKYGCRLPDWPNSFFLGASGSAADRAYVCASRDASEETNEGTYRHPWLARGWRWW